MTNGIIMGNVQGAFLISATIDPANIATATTSEQTFTVPDLRTGDLVYVTKPSVTAGLAVAGARVSAANTLAITFVTTTTNVDAGSEVYKILVIRPTGNIPATSIVD